MKVQSKMTHYGVGPVESLAGTAPGPVPRTDPPSATGRSKSKVVEPNQNSKPGQGKKTSSFNILQFNLGGFSTKKRQNWLTILARMISTLLFYRKHNEEKILS